jgi:polysaccharide pyruvyl transferase WcaK-like protein
MAPADTEKRHGIPTTPINPQPTTAAAETSRNSAHSSRLARIGRRLMAEIQFARRSLGVLRDVDRIVVSGSGQLLDAWRGPWWHPYTTFRWAVLARTTRTPMVYPSVGAGPIDSRLSAFFIRKALDWADYVSVRDGSSARVLRSIGVERELPVVPDMGWGWQRLPVPEPGGSAASSIVGLNAMSHEDPRYWPQGDSARYETYMDKICELTAGLVDNGFQVLLFSSQTRADRAVARDLRELLARRGLRDDPRIQWPVDEIETEDDLAQVVARCDYVVAGRFHSVLLPLALGIPTIGLAYHPKTRELMAQVGQSERCFDIDRFEVADLLTALATIRREDGRDRRAALGAQAERQRARVEAQFDRLFGEPMLAS